MRHPNKPLFNHAWNQIRVWPASLYLAGIQDQPQWPLDSRYYFNVIIDILTITNLYIGIKEGIPKCDLPKCTWLASRISLKRPQVPNIIFIVRIEILTLTNQYLNIHEGIPECDLPTYLYIAGSRISLQRPVGAWYYFWLVNYIDNNLNLFYNEEAF